MNPYHHNHHVQPLGRWERIRRAGLCLLAEVLPGGANVVGGPVDGKEMTPTAQTEEIAGGQPGDPMRFAEGPGRVAVVQNLL